MNQKIKCLIDGGFITINDVLEYAKQYMDGVDKYYEQYADEQGYNDIHEDLYGQDEPEDYPFDITNNRSDDPEYIIASTSYKMEETYIFEADKHGEILDFGEYGGLCYRHGDSNWMSRDLAVQSVFPNKYEFVSNHSISSEVYHSLYKRKS